MLSVVNQAFGEVYTVIDHCFWILKTSVPHSSYLLAGGGREDPGQDRFTAFSFALSESHCPFPT